MNVPNASACHGAPDLGTHKGFGGADVPCEASDDPIVQDAYARMKTSKAEASLFASCAHASP